MKKEYKTLITVLAVLFPFIGICTLRKNRDLKENDEDVKKCIKEETQKTKVSIKKDIPKKNIENIFLENYSNILENDAVLYTGMYQSVWKAVSGKKCNTDKIVKEWDARTRYKWGNSEIIASSEQMHEKLVEEDEKTANENYLAILFAAIKKAGIYVETEQNLIITEENVRAYKEWDDEELYVNDKVEIICPAWYQKGRVIEQGYCRRIDCVAIKNESL